MPCRGNIQSSITKFLNRPATKNIPLQGYINRMVENGKAKIINSSGTFTISVPSKKNWFALLLGTAWLGGWYFAFKMASSTLVTQQPHDPGANGFLICWLIVWTVGGLAVISILLWGYFGREQFVSDRGEVYLKKTILGLGIKKRMDPNEIKNIRTEVANAYWLGSNRWAFWGLGPGKIKFDYGLKTYSFGLGVDDAE